MNQNVVVGPAVVFRVDPVKAARAGFTTQELADLQAAMLDGVRGEKPCDLDALVQTIVALSHFAADHAEMIAEIDLNPVIVHPQGQGVSVVDALIIKQS